LVLLLLLLLALQSLPPLQKLKNVTVSPLLVRTIAPRAQAQHAPVHPQWITKGTHGQLLPKAHAHPWNFQKAAWVP
jgi:hypothetical protein